MARNVAFDQRMTPGRTLMRTASASGGLMATKCFAREKIIEPAEPLSGRWRRIARLRPAPPPDGVDHPAFGTIDCPPIPAMPGAPGLTSSEPKKVRRVLIW